jgi:hypothetical protein
VKNLGKWEVILYRFCSGREDFDVFRNPHLECVRQADGGDVWVLLEVHIAVQPDDGQVIVEIPAVELRVDTHAENV